MAEDIKEEETKKNEQSKTPSEDETQEQEASDEVESEENPEQETPNEETPNEETPTQEQEVEEPSESIPEPPVIKDNPMVQEETPTTNESDETEVDIIEDNENPIQKKQTKIQKILMITAGVLGGILIIGFILYLFGVFDPEEPPKPPMPVPQTMDMNQTKKPEKYIFDAKDINIDRLNGKLRILTKYEIIGTDEEERQKELEKNSKLSTAQINELLQQEQKKIEEDKKKLEEAKRKAEEAKKEQEEKKKQEALKKEQEEKAKAQRPYDLLKFIQVLANDNLLTSLNTEIETFKVKISRCSDNNREFFLIGPFNSNKELNRGFRNIYNNVTQSTTKKDLARLEFNRICK